MTSILGVDFGGVIMAERLMNGERDRRFFTHRFLQVPPMSGVFVALTHLMCRFSGRIFIVSKAQMETREKISRWLRHNNFFRITGINEANLEFCLERADKAGICRRLGVTHFVDDHLEVLSHLATVSNRFVLRPRPGELAEFASLFPSVVRAESWAELLPLILERS